MNMWTLFFGVIFGAIGTGYVMYGKKTGNYLFLLVGIVEIAYGWVVPNPVLNLILGIVLTAIPFVIKK